MTDETVPKRFHWRASVATGTADDALDKMRELSGDTTEIVHRDGMGLVWSKSYVYAIDADRHRITALPRSPHPIDPGEMTLSRSMSLLTMMRSALELIDHYGCETYTSGSGMRCSDEGSGRTRGAEFSADAWCDPCIARDALDMEIRSAPVEHDLLCLPCAARAWSVPIEKLETTAVPGKVYQCPVCGDKWRRPREVG